MKCGDIKERLSEYVDDILDPETRVLVDEHLSACKDCQHTLASLKAVVSELGALDSVEPPEDFLNQLHERMEKRSRFPRILRTLFMPMRVKIPLEFAGAVAVAILVFSILHTQKDQLRLAEPPAGLKQEGASGQVEMENRQAKARKDQGYERPLADISKAPPAERETIELALVMRKEIRPKALAPRAAMEAAPAPKKKIDRSLALPQPAPSAKPERDEEVDDSLLKLTRLIELVGGEVVSVQYDEETNTAESIWAEIPATQIDTFYNRLKELGDLQTPPEAFAGKGEAVLPICIRLLPSK